MENSRQEIQDLISQAQHLLHQAEAIIERQPDELGNGDLESSIDAAQRSLVDAQLSYLEGKQGETLLDAFFRDGPGAFQCEVDWVADRGLLRIFIPDSWTRVNTRPSIYIKDLLKYRNANRVKQFYTSLFQAVLQRENENGYLEGFREFDVCHAVFLFHFTDEYVRDPDNFMIKILIDAAKNSGIFLTDDYEHLVYTAAGIRDKNRSGITLFFSDSNAVIRYFEADLEEIKAGRNHVRLASEKPYSSDEIFKRMW